MRRVNLHKHTHTHTCHIHTKLLWPHSDQKQLPVIPAEPFLSKWRPPIFSNNKQEEPHAVINTDPTPWCVCPPGLKHTAASKSQTDGTCWRSWVSPHWVGEYQTCLAIFLKQSINTLGPSDSDCIFVSTTSSSSRWQKNTLTNTHYQELRYYLSVSVGMFSSEYNQQLNTSRHIH